MHVIMQFVLYHYRKATREEMCLNDLLPILCCLCYVCGVGGLAMWLLVLSCLEWQEDKDWNDSMRRRENEHDTCELLQYHAVNAGCESGDAYAYTWEASSPDVCGDTVLTHFDECTEVEPRELNALFSCYADCQASTFAFTFEWKKRDVAEEGTYDWSDWKGILAGFLGAFASISGLLLCASLKKWVEIHR